MLVLQRIHRLYYREDAFSEVIIGNLPPFSNDSDDYYEKEKKELQARLGKEGYRLTGERRVRLEGQPGYCISFGAIQNLNRLWISCEFPNQQLWVGFIGDQTYAPMLDSIVKHVKPRQ